MVQLNKINRRSAGPSGAGRRIYDLLRGQIADGTLAPGAKMLSTRFLAADLGVSRATITAVYEQLAAEGFLVTSRGRAAHVSDTLHVPNSVKEPAAQTTPFPPQLSAWGQRMVEMEVSAATPHTKSVRYDFRYGALASGDFPRQAWKRAYQKMLLRQQHNLYYAQPEGELPLRQALQGYLRRARGIVCDAEQILVVHGSQQAIDLCARLLLDANDAFAFESPGYLMARHSFEATGARLLPIEVDEHGMDADSLPEGEKARLAYVTPSHQFPLGGVLPISRRVKLLQWAQRQQAWIIEDDYDGEFRYGQRPIDALQSIDSESRVVYIGTISKALSPQLRLGYLVLPHVLVPVFRRAKLLADRHAPTLHQQVLASLIEDGIYERHVRRLSRENELRRAALLEAITQYLPKSIHVAGAAAGLHMVLWLPFLDARNEPDLIAVARIQGLGIYPVSPMFAPALQNSHTRSAGLILGYASLTTEQIRQGIRILASVLEKVGLAS